MSDLTQSIEMMAPSAISERIVPSGVGNSIMDPLGPQPETMGHPDTTEIIASDPNARPAAFRSLAHEILFILTATMSIAQPGFLQGSILIISPTIKSELNMTTAQLTWVISSSL